MIARLKKTSFALALFGLILIPTLFVQAQFVVEEESPSITGSNPSINTIKTFNHAYSIITLFLAILFLAALMGYITSGIKFLIAGGNEKVLEEGRSWAIYATVALAISIVGYIIMNVFKHIIL